MKDTTRYIQPPLYHMVRTLRVASEMSDREKGKKAREATPRVRGAHR